MIPKFKSPPRTLLLVAMVLSLLSLFALPAIAVEPTLVVGNPDCGDLGFGFGFKIDANTGSDVDFTYLFIAGTQNSKTTVLTGGAPSDSGNSVTIPANNGITFDWAATLGIDAVIVKAQNSNAYLYVPEAFSDTGLQAPDEKEISHVEFCYDYELEVEKTAAGTFDREIDWTIEKSVDPAQHDLFAGGSASSDYTVTVTKTTTDSNYRVSGEITITNPSPLDVNFNVTDTLNGVTANVDCDGDDTNGYQYNGTVSADDSVICTYEATADDGVEGDETLNTATVTSFTTGVEGSEATADIIFTPTITGEPDAINVTDNHDNDDLDQDWGPVSETIEWTYSATFTCSTSPGDYTNGFLTFNENNTATIDETSESDSETVTVNCYALVVSKDANTEWTREYTWDISKSVSPVSHTGSAGDTFSSGYTVSVDQTITDSGFRAFGTISVSNPAGSPGDMTVSVADSVNGAVALVTCGNPTGSSLTVAPGATGTCTYSASLASNADLVNTATATFNEIDFTATADVIFEGPTTIIGFSTVNVTDTNGPSWTASGDDSWTYPDNFECPTVASSYTNGEYTESFPNTATITETGQSDDANVNLTCYLQPLAPTKDAAGTYERTVTWDLVKNVNAEGNDLTEYFGVPGDQFNPDWLLFVDKTEAYGSYQVTGSITINNPATIAQTFSVSDELNDGTVASVTCPSYMVPAGGTVECTYTASSTYTGLPADAPNTNTATVSAPGNADQTATATPITYTETLIGVDSGTLTDDRFPAFSETVNADANFTLPETFECSTDRDAYDETGSYLLEVTNIATLNDNIKLEDNASVTVDCEASFVDIYKTTNGEPADPEDDIQFVLYSYDEQPPEEFPKDRVPTEEEIVSTLGNGANLYFQTALVPGDTYTICEYPVPAAYTFEISVDGGLVLTYAGPPGEENPTGEIQCFDFTAPDPAEQVTLTFNVDNSFPGGAPRTPGYWKNWNRCTGGGQADTADKLNDYLGPVDGNGVYLLDDLLPQTLGDSLTITTCEEGILILDSRDLEETKRGQPLNRSNDAAYTLAKALLAARLNQDAGACVPPDFDPVLEYVYDGETLTFEYFEEVLTAADGVLTEVGFTGTGDYLLPKKKQLKELAAYALWLYEVIDDYNNSELCTGEPSH